MPTQRFFSSCLLSAAAMLLAGAIPALALAQSDGLKMYKWTDEQGNLHYSDKLPVEAAKQARDVFNRQGVKVQHVDRALTADERLARDQELARLAKIRSDAEQRTKADQQLLAAYPNEVDLIRAQQQQLEMITNNIHAAETGVQSQEKSLAELLTRAADLERIDKPVPLYLSRQIADLRALIAEQKSYIDRRQTELTVTGQRFETDRVYYRDLIAKTGAGH